MSDKIFNPWTSKPERPEYYHESNIVFKYKGYKIYRQFHKSFLYVYKGIAFNCLAGLNKVHVMRVAEGRRPKGKYSPRHFIYDNAIKRLFTNSKLKL